MAMPWYVQQLQDFANGKFDAGEAWKHRQAGWGDISRNRLRAQNDVSSWFLRDRAARLGGWSRPTDLGYAYNPPAAPQAAYNPQPQQPSPPPPLSKYNQTVDPRYGGMNVQTSIDPEIVYTPEMTQLAVNQQVAQNDQAASLPWLLNQYARPGMATTSPAMLAKAAYPMGIAQANNAIAQTQIPWQDQMANLNFLLKGQTAREKEALGLGGLALQQQNFQRNNDLTNVQSLLGLLTQLA